MQVRGLFSLHEISGSVRGWVDAKRRSVSLQFLKSRFVVFEDQEPKTRFAEYMKGQIALRFVGKVHERTRSDIGSL